MHGVAQLIDDDEHDVRLGTVRGGDLQVGSGVAGMERCGVWPPVRHGVLHEGGLHHPPALPRWRVVLQAPWRKSPGCWLAAGLVIPAMSGRQVL